MSLYKQRGSEVWWLNISHPGHSRVRESPGEHDRDAAQKVHDERKAALWKIDPTLKGRTNDPHHVKVFPLPPQSQLARGFHCNYDKGLCQ